MSSVVLTYSKIIYTNVASQTINLADSGIMGHRVQCPISVDDLNRFFIWQRTSGESVPTGHFTSHNDISGASFSYILANTLSKYYTDIDGVTGGLNFSSAILDSNPDPNIRQDYQITANDIIMAYVIYKLYGSSANPTMNVVYNLQDAYGMLPNSVLVNSIEASLLNEESLANSGAVNEMFQKLLSEDPTRFFDAAGRQIPGLFEVNTTQPSMGSWNFVENDKIELNVQFTFLNSVSAKSVSGDSENITSAVTIPAGTTFKIRLQLVATNTPTAAAAIKQAYVTATTEELIRESAAQKKAAQNATDALAMANQARDAAQTQTATAQAKYNATVTRNTQQRKLVLSAQAAVSAASAALEVAITSGNQANIQQQRAAAFAANALLENQQAIADVAAADLQNAATALATATTNLNAAAAAAANASALVAAANAAAANTALAIETASAAALTSTIAAATAASDPLTHALQVEMDAILDPQNLTTILAKANSVTNIRQSAFNTALHTFANQTSQLNNYNSVLYNMNSAIATGSNDSQIQLFKAMVIGASNAVNQSITQSQNAASTLAASYTTELIAIQTAGFASSNAASLSATLATSKTNSANKTLNTATMAYVYSSTMNTAAAASVTEAQTILNNRIANGAVMTEVQTRTKVLLDANSTYSAATSTMNGSYAKMMNATQAYQAASTVAVNAKVNISSVVAANLFNLHLYQTSVSTSSKYQANVLSNAQLNKLAIQVNSSLVNLNAANVAVATAQANVSIAQMKINTALTNGATLPQVTVLKDVYASAMDDLTAALLNQNSAQDTYNGITLNAANGQVQLLQTDATAYFNASISQPQLATDNIIYYSTLLNYATQQPTAFPPVDGLPSATVYATQLSVWQTYLSDCQTLSDTLLTQFNRDLTRSSALMTLNNSISTSLGSLSNYYIANSNSSHVVFQVNSLSEILSSLSNINVNPSDLQTQFDTYSSQSNTALTTTATAFNTFLADSLSAQAISPISNVGKQILTNAAKFQKTQISLAMKNSQMNFYNSTMDELSMIQLEFDQESVRNILAGQALSNATLANISQAQFVVLQQQYADSSASLATLTNNLNQVSHSISTLTVQLGLIENTFNVASMNGLQAWYDASDPLGTGDIPDNGSIISNWIDKSGKSRNAMAYGSPILTTGSQNSLPGISISGNSGMSITDYFQASIPAGTFLAEMDVFIVYKHTSPVTYNALLTRTNLFETYDSYFGIYTSPANTEFTHPNSLYNTATSLLNINVSQDTSATTSVSEYKNGSGGVLTTASWTPFDNSSSLYLGTRSDQITGFNGIFYEVLIYNTPLTTHERQQVEGYLAWKWGLNTQLPRNHPYFSASPSAPVISTADVPQLIPGIQLWLDATDPLGTGIAPSSGTILKTVADKSGLGHTATFRNRDDTLGRIISGYTGPNTASATYFPGQIVPDYVNSSFLESEIPPGTFINALTAFIVYNCLDVNSNKVLLGRTHKSSSSFWGNAASPLLLEYNNAYVGDSYVGNQANMSGAFNPYSPNTSIFSLTLDQVSKSVSICSNGTTTYDNSSSSWTVSDNGEVLTIFSNECDDYGILNGSLYEVVVFNTVLSTSDKLLMEGYLAWKWGLNTQLPINHPYFSVSPPASVISTKNLSLRQKELAAVQNNELIAQANTIYNTYSQLNDQLQAANQSTNTVLDKISLAMANGADLATIQPLQESLASLQKYIAITQFDALNQYNTYLTLPAPDPSFISTVNATASTLFTATISARLNESAQQLQTAQIEDSAAAIALEQARATLLLVSTQVSIQKQQGLTFDKMVPLTSTFTSASIDVANKNLLLKFSDSALAQAQSNYNTIYSTYSSGNPSPSLSLYTSYANTSTNLVTSFSTLSASQSYQVTSLATATSNVLTADLTNAFMGVLHYSTLTQAEYAHYSDLRVQYNTLMAGGNTDQVAAVYEKMTMAFNKYFADEQSEMLYTAAYLSSLSLATISPSSRAILTTSASNQATILQSAQANELCANLQQANSALFTLNNDFVSAQSAYTIANSDLQIATANDSPKDILQAKFSTMAGRGNELYQVQNQYKLAQSAAQLAQSYVSMNPNAQSILDTAAAKYLLQANLAQANVLVDQYNAAFSNEAQAYSALQVANSALTTAQNTFNTVIAQGSDISVIKSARDAQIAAAQAVTRATVVGTNAMKALNQALQNANLDQIAQSLIITARLTTENTTAGGAVNNAQVQLESYSTIVTSALANLTMATQKNTSVTSTLQAAITNGKTAEEINTLQNELTAATNAATSAQAAFDSAMNTFMNEDKLLSSLTQRFSTTTAALTLNNNNNTLLYNGFVFNQTYDRYVLQPSYLPTPIIAGVPFNLYSDTVTPINLGVYNPSTVYSLGNLVYFPDSDGAQYMCVVSHDPRDL